MAAQQHQGGCHCGAVRFTVTIDLEQPVVSCNCSMCGRAGTLLSFVGTDAFNLDQGDEFLTDYRFNKHAIHHTFCKVCGIKAFAHGLGPKGPMVAINARCIDGVDLAKLNVTQYDGKNR